MQRVARSWHGQWLELRWRLEALPGSTSRGGWPGSASFRVWRRRRPPRTQGAHRSSHSSPPPRSASWSHALAAPQVSAADKCRVRPRLLDWRRHRRLHRCWRLLDGEFAQRRAAERCGQRSGALYRRWLTEAAHRERGLYIVEVVGARRRYRCTCSSQRGHAEGSRKCLRR
jgi:hypothetical protein